MNNTDTSSLLSWAWLVPLEIVKFATLTIPRLVFNIIHFTASITLQLNFTKLFILLFVLTVSTSYFFKYSYLQRYSKLREAPLVKDENFDLHPDVATEQGPKFNNYLDEFLSAIRVFGYLEKPVFHELARHLQTRRLVAGDTLSLDSDKNFYVVVDGVVQVFTQTTDTNGEAYYQDDEDNRCHLLNEVESGGTLSSLFTILSLFTEDVQLRYEPNEIDEILPLDLDQQRSSSNSPRPDQSNADQRIRRDSESTNATLTPDEGSPRLHFASDPPRPRRPTLRTRSTPLANSPPNEYSEGTFARAKVDATLAVIPADAFKRLTKKFPNAVAHIVQVILTRLHRVTFLTSHQYLGLTKELVKTEKAINELAVFPLPRAFYELGGMHRLRQRFLPDVKMPDEPQNDDIDYFNLGPQHASPSFPAETPWNGPRMGPSFRRQDTSKTPAVAVKLKFSQPAKRDSLSISRPMSKRTSSGTGTSNRSISESNPTFAMSPVDARDEDFKTPRPQRERRSSIPSRSSSLDDFDLRDSVMECIAKSIGLVRTQVSHAASPEASPLLSASDAPLQRALFNSSFGSLSYLGVQGRDDESSITASSVASHMSDFALDNEVEILFFPKNSTLVKAGEKNAGLYFCIDGFMDVMMPEEQLPSAFGVNSSVPLSKAGSSGSHVSTDPSIKSFRDSMSRQSRQRLNASAIFEDQEAFTRNDPKRLFTVKAGGIAGYLSSLSGYPSYVDIVAKTDVYVGFLPARALERIMDKQPIVLLTLAKRLISLLPPLVRHIDSALDWQQVNAGQVIYREGDKSDSLYIINQGRLRSISENPHSGGVEILGEYGQGESVGESDCITFSPRCSTLHAIRDSELTRMPMTLFNAISVRHPAITIKISRIIASRVRNELSANKRNGGVQALGKNNFNLKTVCILPVTHQVPITEFATKLRTALEDMGAPTSYLNQATVMSIMGKHAFSRMGKLKLAGWLAEAEQKYRIVLYVADTAVSSPWTQTCIRQADCVLLIAHGASDPSIGEYERLLVGMKTTARKELVLLHADRNVPSGSTRPWLHNRQWIHAHHHCEMPGVPPHKHTSTEKEPVPLTAIRTLRQKVQIQMNKYRNTNIPHRPGSLAATNDFARLARRLCGKSIGLVLGGGGARGISHLGMIRALNERGIPVDMIGGTSIGSFVGGLYAREGDYVSTLGRTKRFSGRMSTLWRLLTDLTYPIVAYTTGHEFNRGIYKSFYDYHIEDMWLSFFCNTTNITHSRMDIHTTGHAWRYIRASMSLAGLLPPLSDEGNMLVDGGYCDNLPVSTMLSMGASAVFAVDVGSIDDTSPRVFGESVSGWWVLLNRWNPWSPTRVIPGITEIQARLTYVSSVKPLEEAKVTPGVLYLRMPVEAYGTMHFQKFQEILDVGYAASKKKLDEWEEADLLPAFTLVGQSSEASKKKGRSIRRNSI